MMRPRQHELETASSRAFEEALPESWVARRQSPDYGIDYLIEIFKGADPTGDMFGVQLKATETADSRRPTVSLRVSTRDYWASFDFPVLVVLWGAAQNRLWWKWAHHHDPWKEDPGQQSFTLRFAQDSNVRSQEAQIAIRDEVRAWRSWHRELPRPLSLVVQVQAEGLGGMRAGEVRARLRRRFDPFRDVIRLTADPASSPYFRMTVQPERTVIRAVGGPSSTLHHEDEAIRNVDEFIGSWTADVLLLIGLRLVRFGAGGLGARLAAGAVSDASAVQVPDVAFEVVQILASHNRVDELMLLLRRLDFVEASEPGVAAAAAMMHPATAMSDDGRQRACDLYVEWAESSVSEGRLNHAARLTYNAARILMDFDPSRAAALLEQAAQYDDGYLDRDYWWRDLGGARFLSGHYEGAVDAYERAIAMGRQDALPLLADAMLFAGDFQASLDLFRQIAADSRLSTPEWRLKQRLLEYLIGAGTGVLEDNRVDPQQMLGERLADLDALLQTGTATPAEREESFNVLLGGALLAETSVPAWGLAIVAASEESSTIFSDVVVTAWKFCGDEILDFLQDAPVERELVSDVRRVLRDLPLGEDSPREIRFIAESGSYESLLVAPTGSTEEDLPEGA